MTFSLMVYLLVVSLLLAAGASLMQSLLRASVPGTRFIWAAAMGASLLLLIVAPARLRVPSIPSATELEAAALVPAAGAVIPVTIPVDLPMSLAERVASVMPSWLPQALGLLWIAASVLALMLLAASYRRHRRRIAGATHDVLDGTAVRVTESLGPAVVGVWRPDIVVPRWLLTRAPQEQSLVVRHERSHVEVGDPALLLAGCAAAAVMPWNPATWYMLGRLRLAIEVDCDRRVLRAGAGAREYGALLIELTSALPAARVGAPAFACRPSHLERRIVAMTARPLTNRPARLLAAGAVAALVVLGACEADLPTATEVEQMDVADVEERVMPALNLDPKAIVYVVDGIIVDRSSAMALDPARIEAVEVTRAGTPRIVVMTRDGKDARDGSTREAEITAEAHAALTTADRQAIELRAAQQNRIVPGVKLPFTEEERLKQPSILLRSDMAGEVELVKPKTVRPDGQPQGEPMVILDGRLMPDGEFRKLRTSEIESIEVVKGRAAQGAYGEKGLNGVLEVTTVKKKTPPADAKKP
jgi:beta-lactamase regulating signal transducer with metallopeptidase domain